MVVSGARPRNFPGLFVGLLAALVVGSALPLLWFFGTEVAPWPLHTPPDSVPLILLKPTSEAVSSRVEEELALLADPAPLFIPTEWNYVVRSQSGGYTHPETPELFPEFGARILLEERLPRAKARGGRESRFGKPEDALLHGDWQVFFGFGETQVEGFAKLHPRLAAFRILCLAKGSIVKSGEIAVGEIAMQAPFDWRPVEKLMMVEELGPAGVPLALSGSGDENWDGALERWTQGARLWVDLAPGLYHLTLGP